MAKTGSGAIAGAGRRKDEFVGWDEGLTEADKANLLEIQDHTDKVIEALGTAIARGLEAVGIEAESDAAAICPVDTGRLRNSITHTIDGNESAAIIGTNVEYALYVHEGVHGRKGQPFLTNAVTQNADKYRRILKAALSG
jgi:HK97 gp10 family phage protein